MRKNICDIKCNKKDICERYKKCKILGVKITNCYKDKKILYLSEYDIH